MKKHEKKFSTNPYREAFMAKAALATKVSQEPKYTYCYECGIKISEKEALVFDCEPHCSFCCPTCSCGEYASESWAGTNYCSMCI